MKERGIDWAEQENFRIINAWARWRWDKEDKAKKRGERSRRRYADSDSQQSKPETEPEGQLKLGHYEALGVPQDATVAERVKAARRRLIEVQPDKHPEDRDDPVMKNYWTDEAVEIIAAQDIRGDEANKCLYDCSQA